MPVVRGKTARTSILRAKGAGRHAAAVRQRSHWEEAIVKLCEARECGVAVAPPLIDTYVPLVLIVAFERRAAIVVRRPWRGGKRITLQQRLRNWVHPLGRNRVPGERCSREIRRCGGVVNDRYSAANRLGEDALALQL